MLAEDLSAGYPPLRTAAEAEADRGTLRALTWGQKVTTMLLSLVRQYRQRGEAMLEKHPDLGLYHLRLYLSWGKAPGCLPGVQGAGLEI